MEPSAVSQAPQQGQQPESPNLQATPSTQQKKLVVPRQKDSFAKGVQKSIGTFFSRILHWAAIVIVVLFLLSLGLQSVQPMTHSVVGSFHDAKYRAFLLANPKAPPSLGTQDGEPLPTFPKIAEIRTVVAGELLYETSALTVSFARTEVVEGYTYAQEKYVGIVDIQEKQPSLWERISSFMRKETYLYSGQALQLGAEYWFVYEVDGEQLLLGRFAEPAEAEPFPLALEIPQ